MKNDFNLASEYIEKSFTKDEVITILSGDNGIKKAAAILNLDDLSDPKISSAVINHLTNQSGPIREVCAFKLNTLMEKAKDNFQNDDVLDIIINSLNDVNPNVVRLMLDTLKNIDNKKYIFKKLMIKIDELYGEISKIPRRGKEQEHIFTKKCFKIYWSLESIKTLLMLDISLKNLLTNDFLMKLSKVETYTVREKIAQIVNLLPETEFSDIKNILANDENYFVKRGNKK